MSQTITHKAASPHVAPYFDGAAVLPRIEAWTELRSRLQKGTETIELDASFFELPLGRAYREQLAGFGLMADHAAVRLEAAEGGLTATILLPGPGRILEDRWTLEVDANGVVQDLRSELGTGYAGYRADEHSRFFDTILSRA